MTPPTPTPLDQARAACRAGDLPTAERLCRRLVESEPGHGEAWHLLAAALQGQGKHADALDAFRKAVQLHPASAEAHLGLAALLAALGRRDEADAGFRRVLRLRPGHPDALAQLGLLLAEQGKLDEAVAFLRQAVKARPEFAPARHNLGVALAQQGKPEEAARELEEAIRLKPDYAEAFYNLGNVLQGMGKRDEAVAKYREAVRLRPGYGEAYNNLGLALTEAGKHGEAAVILEQAVRLRPQAAEGHNNLGLACAGLGRFDDAERCYREALRIDPRYVEAHNNLGSCFKERGRLEEALAYYQVALWHDPKSPSTRYNRSLALLQSGDWAEGWKEYEQRWKRKGVKERAFRQPRWDGSPLDGKTVLLWCEQGLGDAVHFVRYAAPVKAKGGRVALECPGFMVPLFSSCPGIDQLVAEGSELPDFDVQAPLMSLPMLLGTTLDGVPAGAPYLSAEPGRVEKWKARLDAIPGFKVGVAWQGNPHFSWDCWRSFPLEALAPLAAVEGVRLFSLQKGPGAEQARGLKGRFAVEGLDGLDAEGGAFLDTAAVMTCLDLVVTADTAAAHLAGALGAPAWVALSATADWRWLLGREDTPWYPTLRLFRQKTLGEWSEVFMRMAAELRRRAAAGRPAVPRAPLSPGDLLDRIGILEIKAERFADAGRRAQARAELAALWEARDAVVPASDELTRLAAELKAINEGLWEVEDALRRCERDGDFGPRFVELARSVYRRNDQRAALKRRINESAGAPFGEQKEYAAAEGDGCG
jgi:tetratricopeptide (TPR) repeat protein